MTHTRPGRPRSILSQSVLCSLVVLIFYHAPARSGDVAVLDLIGTIVGPNAAQAIFRDPSNGKTIYLRIGDTRDGWRLRSIEPQVATFEKLGEQVIYRLSARSALAADPVKAQSVPALAQPAPSQPGVAASRRGDLPAFDASRVAPPDPVTERLRRMRP